MRPRLLAWLASFTRQAERTGTLPRLRALAAALHDRLGARWPDVRHPDVRVPDYPALAQPSSALAQPPRGWQPHRSRE